MQTFRLLWLLMALFGLRVLGQVLVEFLHVDFLPPSEEWFSGLLPYPHLLASQVLILLLMSKIGWDFAQRSGWSYRPRRHAGTALLVFGAIYLVVMVIRYVVRMALYPHERWTGGSIPIFFHWVLAFYVLVLGIHHWQTRPGGGDTAGLGRRRWLTGALWIAGSGALTTAISLWILYMLLPSLLASYVSIRGPEFAVRIERGLKLTTSDGVDLVADAYHPRRAGPKRPTILVRVPYSKTITNRLIATIAGQMWAERGYTVVIQGTRGKYESGGAYDPLRHEREDGIETLRWLAQQEWYDGRLGMWGGSYFGYTQWVVADCKDPGPTALLIQEASTDFYGMFYPGGAFSLKSALHWAATSRQRLDRTPDADALARGFASLPLVEADDRAVGDIRFFNDWVIHNTRDEYWAQIDGHERPGRLQAPVLLMAGWFDPFLPTQLSDYVHIQREADRHVASESRLVIGPWAHAETVQFPDGTVPRHYRLESIAPSVPWFDRHLQGKTTPSTAPVRLYIMGIHQWRDEQQWPLARTEYTSYYLHSNGKANTASGDGTLTRVSPEAPEPPDVFVYDPKNPVPSAGGAMLDFKLPSAGRGTESASTGFTAGMKRQNEVEQRNDLLVYTTDLLPTDVEVTGPIKLILFVSTSAPNTDFTAKLVDVFSDGSAYNVSEGILRRNYETPAEGGTQIQIDLWPTSTVFLKGHRIRLEVSSSNYPRFDRNPNTGRRTATETAPITANQTVHHGPASPSQLVLPIIPTGR